MSKKYPGGFITKSPSAPTNPIATTAAPGIWTVEQATQLIQAGVWPSPANIPVETVFSTYIYSGNNSTQTITNGIDLAGNGGLVWVKARNSAFYHALNDTARGAGNVLQSQSTSANINQGSNGITAFTSSGFSFGSENGYNSTGTNYVSWTFREAPKFFDIVTYTGNGSVGRALSHNLGIAPGCIIVKRTNSTGAWYVYHRSRGSGEAAILNLTNQFNADSIWFYTDPTATEFTVSSDTNINGATYVAYLFAHDTTTYGTIQCGSFTTDGTGAASATLGWEPQWLLVKAATTTGDWTIADTIRGMQAVPANNGAQLLYANTTGVESSGGFTRPNATGFTFAGGFGNTTYVYIAIRRGLMGPPTTGTNVFSPNLTTSSGQGATVSTGFPVDLQISFITSGTIFNAGFVDRLRGINSNNNVGTTSYPKLTSSSDAAETFISVSQGWNNTGFAVSEALANTNTVYWNFRRAAGFFDEVCYTGTGSNTTVSHKLTVVPELMIVKRRNSSTGNWWVYTANLGPTNGLNLNNDASVNTSIASIWNSTAPTASVFSVGVNAQVNASGINYVAYLFATCPGASKVGSYTGNGSSQTIDCGFTTGARFIMIKRTDSTGNWWVWDSARGIVASFDPAAPINLTGGQVLTADTIDTDNTGFIVNQEATINANVNGGSYIFFAVS